MVAGHPPVGLEGTSPPRAPERGGTGAALRGVGPDDDSFPSFEARRDYGARAPSGGSSRRAPTTNSHKRSEEARRFAASAAAMQRDLARELRRGEMRSARVPKKAPPDASGPGYFETFPRAAVSGKSKPTLLCDLERLLRDKLRLARLTGAGADDGDDARSLSTSDDDATYELASLDAYRQTFDAFVDAFVTYKPLLSEIKTRYDRALDAALRSERACAGLRAEVAAAERRRLAEVREARAETMTKAANVRGDALRRAAAAEAKVAAAEARAAAAEAETARWRAHAEAADRRTAEAEEKSAALRRRVDAETSWAEARGDAAERLLSSEMYPVPRDFARADAELEDGEGGLNREPGGEEPSAPGEREETGGEAEEADAEADAPEEEKASSG